MMCLTGYNPPRLYKLTSTSKIQVWKISVCENKITREFGQLDGKIQVNEEEIKEGKNIGRSNETTPNQQAVREAESDWEKKLAKDYFLELEQAKAQTVRLAKEGGYLPMLAQDYKKHAVKHLSFPCIVQTKLDGIRCIATKFDGVVNLWFRSGKPILSLPSINEQLTHLMYNNEIFDGELYIHGEDFNEFTGAIKANKNLNEQITSRIQYHMYDVPKIDIYNEEDGFNTRFTKLVARFNDCTENIGNIKLTETQFISTLDESMEWYEKWIAQGYEGMMFRNCNMPYEQKRSYNLLKYKDMIDEEFKIIDTIIVDRFNNLKHYKVVCTTKEGVIVTAKMKGKQAPLAKLFSNPEELIGKMATIQFFGYTPDGSLRFPVGKTIRFDK